MALVELEHYYPSVKQTGDYDLTNFNVIAKGDEKVGTVASVLVEDRSQRIRYLVVDAGFWLLGKKLLLPIGLAEIVYMDRQVYVENLTKEQIKALPEYQDNITANSSYEEQIHQILSTFAIPESGQPGNPAAYDLDAEGTLYTVKDQRLKSLQEQLNQGQLH
jgi:hypothetical protein